MAEVHKIVCDRCGRNIIKKADNDRHLVTKYDEAGQKLALLDLCEPCYAQLEDWLRNSGGAPIGYKFQPRPCPHMVPCADPNGCSGMELIPV